jgi:hypothetical protein
MHGSASDGGTLAHITGPVKISVENRWNSSGKQWEEPKISMAWYFIWSPRRRTRNVSVGVYGPCPSESFRAILSGAIFLVHIGLNSLIFAARVSSDNPRLKAFCRVAPSVLFKVPAIFAARVLFFASFFKIRTSFDVQVRLRLFMLIS